MAEEKNGLFQSGFVWAGPGSGAEAGFEDIAEGTLAVELDAPAESLGVRGGQGDAGIDGGFRVGGRLGLNQLAEQMEQSGQAAPGSGEQGAHGDGQVWRVGHWGPFRADFRGRARGFSDSTTVKRLGLRRDPRDRRETVVVVVVQEAQSVAKMPQCREGSWRLIYPVR